MISERVVWKLAMLMVRRYGATAPLQVAMRCHEALDHEDIRRCAIWLHVFDAVVRLQTPRGNSGPVQ